MIARQNDAALGRRMSAPRARFSPRHTALVRESWSLLVVAAVGFLTLILATYHKTDPGWSYSGAGAAVQNKGGIVGAWLADLLLYLFGVSAWWWIFAGVVVVVNGYRGGAAPSKSAASGSGPRHPWLAVPGFAVVLGAGAALEAAAL